MMKHNKVITKINIFSGSFFFFACLFLASCSKNENTTGAAYDVIYVETNNFNTGQNAVIAYKDNGDGVLTQLTGSPFLTSGTGVSDLAQGLGPLDSDFELRISADKKFLLAVNSGSNTIAVFSINSDGTLVQVPGSPFASGGQTPVSIGVSDNTVFVVNKSQDPLALTPQAPNYSTFTIDATGKLTPVTGGKFEVMAGVSPSQALVSNDKKYLYGTDFLSFMLTTPLPSLKAFAIGSTGTLSTLAGSPYATPVTPDAALGLWQHPSGTPLYVGFPVQGKIGVYNVNATTGALTFQTSVAAGKAACWFRTNSVGNHLYALNSGDNVVQVYNTASPLLPVSIQSLQLKNSGPLYGGPGFTTSEDFSLCLSTNEKTLYVVCQHTNTDFSIGNFNFLHVLKVADDGTLTEPADPIQLPVPNTIRPKGSAVISRQ